MHTSCSRGESLEERGQLGLLLESAPVLGEDQAHLAHLADEMLAEVLLALQLLRELVQACVALGLVVEDVGLELLRLLLQIPNLCVLWKTKRGKVSQNMRAVEGFTNRVRTALCLEKRKGTAHEPCNG